MSARFRFLAALIPGALLAMLVFWTTTADAELDSVAAPGIWGVGDRIQGPVLNDKELVRAIHSVGNRTYVGGFFRDVRDPRTGSRFDQAHLAAYDRLTGAWISTFRVDIDGPVLAIDSSDDGHRLFIGGDFTKANGDPAASGLVSLDPQTGAVQRDWRADVGSTFADSDVSIDALVTAGDQLYVGGNFTSITDLAGTTHQVGRLARLAVADGAVDPVWTPTARGGRVADIALSPDGQRAYLGGRFDRINGDPTAHRFAAVDTNRGALLATVPQGMRIYNQPWSSDQPLNGRASRDAHFPFDVHAFGDYVAWAGDQTVEVVRASDLSHVWTWTAASTDGGICEPDGDVQTLADRDGWLYFGGHFTGRDSGCTTSPAVLSRWHPVEGWDLSYRPTFSASAPSLWALDVDRDGALWIGGRFTSVAGRQAESLGKLVPASTDDVRPAIPTGLEVTGSSSVSIGLRWNPSTDDVGVVGYRVHDADTDLPVLDVAETQAVIENRNTGRSYRFYVVAVDASNNVSWKSDVVAGVARGGSEGDTEPPATPTGLRLMATGRGSATLSWNPTTDNMGELQYRVFNAETGRVLAAVTDQATEISGLRPGGTYLFYVRALDGAGNYSWRTNITEATVG